MKYVFGILTGVVLTRLYLNQRFAKSQMILLVEKNIKKRLNKFVEYQFPDSTSKEREIAVREVIEDKGEKNYS